MRRTHRRREPAQCVPPSGHLGLRPAPFVSIGEDYIEVPVETWLYNLGPNKLMRRISFEGGYVVDIETLGYGYN